MPRKLILICHLERLGPEYHPGYVDFWLGLTAGFDDVTDITLVEQKLLQTWLWSVNTIIVAGFATGAAEPVLLDANKVVALRLPANYFTDTTDFTTCLNDHFTRAVNTTDGFRLDPKPSVGSESLPWHAFLSSASTWPGGLADHMNLALRFRVKSTDLAGLTEVIAAPAFDIGKPFAVPCGPLDPATPNSFQTIGAGNGRVYEWSFSPTDASQQPGIAVFAQQAPCSTALAPIVGDPTVDIAKLLPIGFEPGAGASDWTEYLELKLAGFFDLPQLLLGVLRSRLNNNVPLFSTGLHQLFMASLRDIANLGLSIAPDNTTLASDLLDASGLPGDLQPLLNADQLVTYAVWHTTLHDALQGVYKQAPDIPLDNSNFQTAENNAADLAASNPTAYLAALDRLHSQIALEDTLTALIQTTWTNILGLAQADKSAQLIKLQSELKANRVRPRMLLGNFGAAWRTLKFSSLADLQAQVEGLLSNYVQQRGVVPAAGNGVPVFGQAVYPAALTAIPPADLTALAAEVVANVHVALTTLISDSFDKSNPDIRAEGILIPTGAFRTASPSTDATDSHRRIAGAGIFLKRDDNNAEWTMLNFATLGDTKATPLATPTDAHIDPLITGAIPIPLKFQYRSGVSTAIQVYQNRPLAAEYSDDADHTFNSADTTGAYAPVFRLLNPYPFEGQKPFLEGLAYGQNYLVWVHLFGRGNELPSELTHVDATASPAANLPWQLAMPKPGDLATAKPAPFHRRNTLGPVRLSTALAKPSELKWPSIPSGVQTVRDSIANPKGKRDATNTGQNTANNIPLLLMVPAAPDPTGKPALPQPAWNSVVPAKFTLYAFPPVVDKDVWRRWVGYGPETSTLRKYVRDNSKSASFLIDDFAATTLEIAYRRVYPPPADNSWATTSATFPARPAGTVSTTPIPIVVTTAPISLDDPPVNPGFSLIANGASVAVSAPEGEVWTIRLRPRVSNTDLPKFHDDLRPLVGAAFSGDPQAHGETFFTIEVATSWRTARLQSVRDRLNNAISFTPNPEPDLLDVYLKPDSSFANHVCRADLLVQRWRWDGRPLYQPVSSTNPTPQYGYPFAQNFVPADTEPMDALLFGSRDPSDHFETSRNFDFIAADDPTKPILLERRDHTQLSGALYYRFALRAHSRYEALFQKQQDGILETLPAPGPIERWKHMIVPCRLHQTLPPPTLRAILPLTATGGSGKTGPANASLLLVLDDQWYRDELAGMAELLEGEILQVALPSSALESRPEFGPDPIVAMPDDPLRNLPIVLPPTIGAIGTTFDANTNSALFAKTSFIQPAPVLQDPNNSTNPLDLTFYFMQVRYRRILHPNAVHGTVPAMSLQSSWTAAQWVQFLPPADRFRVQNGNEVIPVYVHDLTYEAAAGKLGRQSQPGDMILPTASTTSGLPVNDLRSKPVFTLICLITRQVPDAFGHTDRESFVMLCPISSIPPQADSDSLRIRILELQHRRDLNLPSAFTDGVTGASFASTVFSYLFPPADQDASARIVRVSPYIAAG